MSVRVELDRNDRKYYYGQTAKMEVFATNDSKAPAIVHGVKTRALTESLQKIPPGSRRVDPGESKCLWQVQ